VNSVEIVGLVLGQPRDVAQRRIADVFVRQVKERCPAEVVVGQSGPVTVELRIEPGGPAEGFRIEDSSGATPTIRIAAADRLGLLYGVGKFLHTSRYGSCGFSAGAWRGASAPECPCRHLPGHALQQLLRGGAGRGRRAVRRGPGPVGRQHGGRPLPDAPVREPRRAGGSGQPAPESVVC